MGQFLIVFHSDWFDILFLFHGQLFFYMWHENYFQVFIYCIVYTSKNFLCLFKTGCISNMVSLWTFHWLLMLQSIVLVNMLNKVDLIWTNFFIWADSDLRIIVRLTVDLHLTYVPFTQICQSAIYLVHMDSISVKT